MKNFAFIGNTINEYAEVTSRAYAHGAEPSQVVAMVAYTPQTKYVNHKNAIAIGVRDNKLQVWCDSIPSDCEVMTLQDVRKLLPLHIERSL